MKEKRIYGLQTEISEEHVKSFYNKRAASFEQSGYNTVLLGSQDSAAVEQKNRFERDYIMPMLNIGGGTRVLDIGCGIGRWAEFVMPECGFYYGVDFSEEMVKAAKTVCSRYGGNYCVEQMSAAEAAAQSPAYFGGKFDAVIAAGVFMYINDKALKEVFQQLPHLLEWNSRIFFTEPVGLERRLTLKDFPSEALKTEYSAIYRTPEEYNALYGPLQAAGFSVLAQDFIPEYGDHYSDTGRWFTVLKRN